MAGRPFHCREDRQVRLNDSIGWNPRRVNPGSQEKLHVPPTV